MIVYHTRRCDGLSPQFRFDNDKYNDVKKYLSLASTAACGSESDASVGEE